jgi:ligand-binding sensor domain-containing protein/two-component sensor histidine kinase
MKSSLLKFIAGILLVFFDLQDAISLDSSDTVIALLKSNIDFGSGEKTVSQIYHHADGTLWATRLSDISRNDAANRYDYLTTRQSHRSTPSTNASAIASHPITGELFIATEDSGIIYYNAKQDRFEKLLFNKKDLLPSPHVTAMAIDSYGEIWAGHGEGLISRISSLRNTKIVLDPLDSSRITDIVINDSGVLFASASAGIIYRIDPKTNAHSIAMDLRTCGFDFGHIRHLDIDNSGKFWLSTSKGGALVTDAQKGTCPTESDIVLDTDSTFVSDIFVDHETNTIWISTHEGLLVLRDNKQILHFHKQNSVLETNEVYHVTKSNEGHYWIATYNGVYVAIETPFHLVKTETGGKLVDVMHITGSQSDFLWVAAYSGLHAISRASYKPVDFKKALPSHSTYEKEITTFAADEEHVWFGYRARGAERLNLASGEVLRFGVSEARTLDSDLVSRILPLGNGETLIGTINGGLHIVRANTSTERLSDRNGTLPAQYSVLMLHKTSDGKIWLGLDIGLFQYNHDTAEVQRINLTTNGSFGSSEPLIWAMSETSNGELWFGSQHHGLFRLHAQEMNGKAEQVFSNRQERSFVIYSIEADYRGDVWMSTDNGLSRYRPSDGSIHHVPQIYGLQDTDFELGASHRDSTGKIFFGGTNGLNFFDPRHIVFDSPPPKLVFSKIEINGQSISAPKLLHALENVVITHTDTLLNATVSVLDFIDPNNNLYRFKLDGFDSQWIEKGTNNTVTYTNLSPGTYVLRAQGANSAGIWNREGIAIEIEVLPAPWRTWWAYCTYALLGLIALLVARKYYDTWVLKNDALRLAEEMTLTADKALDDLQEEVDYHDELVKASYEHKVDTLNLIRDCVAKEANLSPEFVTRRSTRKDLGRLAALRVYEECLFYQSETLLANLGRYIDDLFAEMLPASGVPEESISSVNEVPSRRIPVAVATPLSIAIYELLDNVIEHAFSVDSPVNFVLVKLEWLDPINPREQNTLRLTVQDSGPGITETEGVPAKTATGLQIVAEIADRLEGALYFSNRGGTRVTLDVPDPNQFV